MARFSPRPNVLCNVKMTRAAYAQLLGQKFFPPKIFGHFEEREGTDTWRWRDVGMKLVSRFTHARLSSHPHASDRLVVLKCCFKNRKTVRMLLDRPLKR
jgi:hypothetical protein